MKLYVGFTTNQNNHTEDDLETATRNNNSIERMWNIIHTMKKTACWHGSWSIQQRKFHYGLSHIIEFLGILFFKMVKNEEIIVNAKKWQSNNIPFKDNESREDWNWIRGYHAGNSNPRKVGFHPHLYLITFTIISFNNALLEPISPRMYWILMQTNGALLILLMTKYNNCFLVTQIYPIFIQ